MRKTACIFLVITLVSSVFISCRSARDKEMDNIKALKHSYEQSGKTEHPDMALAQKLDAAYKDFISHYPKDSATPALLYNDALLNNNPLAKVDQAIIQLKQIVASYPESRFAPQALMLMGFLYEVNLNDANHARDSYQKLVDKYPSSPLANDARRSIEDMGKDWNSMFKEKKDSVTNP